MHEFMVFEMSIQFLKYFSFYRVGMRLWNERLKVKAQGEKNPSKNKATEKQNGKNESEFIMINGISGQFKHNDDEKKEQIILNRKYAVWLPLDMF